MRITLILVALLIGCLAIGFCATRTCPASPDDVKVGLFYYVWYNGTLGQGHWNGTVPDDPDSRKWTVVDEPALDFYNSSNPYLIKPHLDWFKLLGIDFLIISWWGMNSFEDAATKVLFQQTSQHYPDLKLVIMVEGFNESADNYDFDYIRSYINTTYYGVYPNMTLRIGSLPLLCWWNAENMTGTLDRPRPDRIDEIHDDLLFDNRILGHNSYVDWYAWTPCTVNSSELPVLSRDGFTVIEPRFDYSHIDNSSQPYDPDYSEGLYEKQWSQVRNWTETQSVKYVAIYSWNEYHERSQIEPHITDGNHILTPFLDTRSNVLAIPEYLGPLMIISFLTATLLAATVYRNRSPRISWRAL